MNVPLPKEPPATGLGVVAAVVVEVDEVGVAPATCAAPAAAAAATATSAVSRAVARFAPTPPMA
jgi:hypothetical protein